MAPIDVFNPTGTLTIAGVPSIYGETKPIILAKPTSGGDIRINGDGLNRVYGSIKLVNIHYQTMQMDGYQNDKLFYCGTADRLKQTLTIDNCLFEFSNIDLFDCTNESGAIGGWPYGASFFITNSYFRNMFHPAQWWGSRVFQCKHPIDTLWVENCTVTTGGLTFLQQNELTAFAYFNHNTLVNNKKNWLLGKYCIAYFVANNIFVNQNWVGEDTNVTSSGTNPDRSFTSTINLDSVDYQDGVVVQPKYYASDSSHYTDEVNPINMKVFVSNNVSYNDTLMSRYYHNEGGAYDSVIYSYPLSYLDWAGLGSGPWKIENMPGELMNSRTKAMFTKYSPEDRGGFIEDSTWTGDPHMQTPDIADAATADQMAKWNQYQWNDPRWPVSSNDIIHSKYIYGDYSPMTLPGIIDGTKTDAVTYMTTLRPGDQVGIDRFTDLTENFSQSTFVSSIDEMPVGSLIWNDADNAVYLGRSAGFAGSMEFKAVRAAYLSAGGNPDAVREVRFGIPEAFALDQNYPNPFNPATVITYSLPRNGFVSLKEYNVLGQEVTTLFCGTQPAGKHQATFNGGRFASGVYFYRLQSGDALITGKKMTLIK